MLSLLKPLFSSKTRINILNLFFQHPEEEIFVREITRQTGEQINSVRRELEHLEQIGMFTFRTRAGKKYFKLNSDFFFFDELASIFQKVNSPAIEVAEKLKKIGKKIDLVVLTGHFIGAEDELPIDIFIVGDIQKERIEKYITEELEADTPIRFALISRAEFLQRVKTKDPVLKKILSYKKNIIPINLVRELL